MAAGEGKRFGATGINKTAVEFDGKPLVKYGTDLLDKIIDKVIVVVGAYAESVIKAVGDDKKVTFLHQFGLPGTGGGTRDAVNEMEKWKINPEKVWVGYGDHMMFYTLQIAVNLGKCLEAGKTAVAMVTFDCFEDNRYGRIARLADGSVEKIVEYKDATEAERQLTEANAGFYCFDYNFLRYGVEKLTPSPVTGEYYLTDVIQMAVNRGLKVQAVKVPYEFVGIGINTREEFEASQRLHHEVRK